MCTIRQAENKIKNTKIKCREPNKGKLQMKRGALEVKKMSTE